MKFKKTKFLQWFKDFKVASLEFIKDPLLLKKWEVSYHRNEIENRITAVVNIGYKKLIHHDNYKIDLFMFVQDMTNFIMPVRTPREYELTVHPKNKTKEEIIAKSFNKGDNKNNINKAIEKFIGEVGHHLFYYTEVFYEIVIKENKEGGVVELNYLSIFPPSMISVFGHYFQFIPWKTAKSAQIKAGFRRIPKENILHIRFPESLGGKWKLKTIINNLASLSKMIIPDFRIKNVDESNSYDFNLELYSDDKYIEKAQLTKKLGWNQRKILDNNILEYYSILTGTPKTRHRVHHSSH